MKSIDMRSRSSESRHAWREQVIRLRDAGLTYLEIASQTGMSRTGVFDICKRHDASGPGALYDKPNGRKLGYGRLLGPAQESIMCALIGDHTPEQLNVPGQLWTPAGVAQLVARRLGIYLERRAMQIYLSRWGYPRHAPMEHSRASTAPALQHWLDCELPVIQARARFEDAEILWGHEGPLTVATNGSAPPEGVAVRTDGSNVEQLVLSAVNSRGSRFWMTLHGRLDAAACVDFVNRLIHGREHKVFLMLDEMQVHQARAVVVWLAEHDELIEVFCLPGQVGVQVRPERSHGGLLPSSADSTSDR